MSRSISPSTYSSEYGAAAASDVSMKSIKNVHFYLRDRNKNMVAAWKRCFEGTGLLDNRIYISNGDIFKGAPSADAIVSPANSFGFMDGGIDAAYLRHFGQQMETRLQKQIRKKHSGELLVGSAIVMTTLEKEDDQAYMLSVPNWPGCNGNKPIKWLISAPTMRVPQKIPDTVNPYLAFRAIILAIEAHNKRNDVSPILSVIMPGLGTAVGKMPHDRCAYQMLQAYETYVQHKHPDYIKPTTLENVWDHDIAMKEYRDGAATKAKKQ